ncbi:PREDICTED: ferritin-2 heavy chain-like [Priapulus caudatus]|uniref:Ferritin n=1 Tax=Priapulus caudatus TaxID=37621 RepID=A0ABM1DP12_PRICU|nr:PREDICTED: ferritin-2 heavy chain-like [Priapulus caudatus]
MGLIHMIVIDEHIRSVSFIVFLQAPENTVWEATDAVLKALQLEKEVLASFLNIHSKAQARNDPHLIDFVETVFLTEQYDAMEELSTMATKFERAGTGLGEYIVDKNLQ